MQDPKEQENRIRRSRSKEGSQGLGNLLGQWGWISPAVASLPR